MIKSKIGYLLLLACMILFYILFIDSMSLLILIITALFPFLQLFILLRISKNMTATLTTESASVHRNTSSKIIVKLKNSSFFPVSSAVVSLDITNTLTHETQSLTTMLPVASDNEQSIKFSVSYAHCGKVTVNLKSIRIYDYIKLFSKVINYNITKDITVIPTLETISPAVEATLNTITENEEFSRVKPGDDCSEIFNIREYIYGDKINRIHWNLTTKLDDLMVKEYSLPVSCQIMILFEFCSDTSSEHMFDKNDAAIESAMALSYYMINNSISHLISWYDPHTRLFHTEKISSEEDFTVFLSAIFTSGYYENISSAFIHSKAENGDKHFSHEIYISPVISDELFLNFSVMKGANYKTYLYINDDTKLPDYFTDSDNTHAVEVKCDNISEGLNKVII